MNFKGILNIPLVNSFVNLIPAKFEITRPERATPIGRGLVRAPLRNHSLNNSVM